MRNKLKESCQQQVEVNTHTHVDTKSDDVFVTLSPGGLFISNKDVIVTTILGSCIAVCVRDTQHGITGINHFMVPGKEEQINESQSDDKFRYGIYSLNYMFKHLYNYGAQKNLLDVKVFGGGSIISNKGHVGCENIEFLENYLADLQITVTSRDLGGTLPRKVNYFTHTGKVYVKRLRGLHKHVVSIRENSI